MGKSFTGSESHGARAASGGEAWQTGSADLDVTRARASGGIHCMGGNDHFEILSRLIRRHCRKLAYLFTAYYRLVVTRMLHRRVAKRLMRWMGASSACNDWSFIHSHATHHDRDVLFAAMRSRCQDPADVRRLALT